MRKAGDELPAGQVTRGPEENDDMRRDGVIALATAGTGARGWVRDGLHLKFRHGSNLGTGVLPQGDRLVTQFHQSADQVFSASRPQGAKHPCGGGIDVRGSSRKGTDRHR
jgi:hypothetical protein